MQPRERIAGERQPVRVDEPGDVEHAQSIAHQIGLLRQPLVELVERGAEFLRRGARPFIGEAFLGGALPELDLDLLVAIRRAPHRAGAIRGITLKRRRRLRRPGRIEHEAKAQGAQIEMQIVLVLEQRRDLVLVADRE